MVVRGFLWILVGLVSFLPNSKASCFVDEDGVQICLASKDHKERNDEAFKEKPKVNDISNRQEPQNLQKTEKVSVTNSNAKNSVESNTVKAPTDVSVVGKGTVNNGGASVKKPSSNAPNRQRPQNLQKANKVSVTNGNAKNPNPKNPIKNNAVKKPTDVSIAGKNKPSSNTPNRQRPQNLQRAEKISVTNGNAKNSVKSNTVKEPIDVPVISKNTANGLDKTNATKAKSDVANLQFVKQIQPTKINSIENYREDAQAFEVKRSNSTAPVKRTIKGSKVKSKTEKKINTIPRREKTKTLNLQNKNINYIPDSNIVAKDIDEKNAVEKENIFQYPIDQNDSSSGYSSNSSSLDKDFAKNQKLNSKKSKRNKKKKKDKKEERYFDPVIGENAINPRTKNILEDDSSKKSLSAKTGEKYNNKAIGESLGVDLNKLISDCQIVVEKFKEENKGFNFGRKKFDIAIAGGFLARPAILLTGFSTGDVSKGQDAVGSASEDSGFLPGVFGKISLNIGSDEKFGFINGEVGGVFSGAGGVGFDSRINFGFGWATNRKSKTFYVERLIGLDFRYWNLSPVLVSHMDGADSLGDSVAQMSAHGVPSPSNLTVQGKMLSGAALFGLRFVEYVGSKHIFTQNINFSIGPGYFYGSNPNDVSDIGLLANINFLFEYSYALTNISYLRWFLQCDLSGTLSASNRSPINQSGINELVKEVNRVSDIIAKSMQKGGHLQDFIRMANITAMASMKTIKGTLDSLSILLNGDGGKSMGIDVLSKLVNGSTSPSYVVARLNSILGPYRQLPFQEMMKQLGEEENLYPMEKSLEDNKILQYLGALDGSKVSEVQSVFGSDGSFEDFTKRLSDLEDANNSLQIVKTFEDAYNTLSSQDINTLLGLLNGDVTLQTALSNLDYFNNEKLCEFNGYKLGEKIASEFDHIDISDEALAKFTNSLKGMGFSESDADTLAQKEVAVTEFSRLDSLKGGLVDVIKSVAKDYDNPSVTPDTNTEIDKLVHGLEKIGLTGDIAHNEAGSILERIKLHAFPDNIVLDPLSLAAKNYLTGLGIPDDVIEKTMNRFQSEEAKGTYDPANENKCFFQDAMSVFKGFHGTIDFEGVVALSKAMLDGFDLSDKNLESEIKKWRDEMHSEDALTDFASKMEDLLHQGDGAKVLHDFQKSLPGSIDIPAMYRALYGSDPDKNLLPDIALFEKINSILKQHPEWLKSVQDLADKSGTMDDIKKNVYNFYVAHSFDRDIIGMLKDRIDYRSIEEKSFDKILEDYPDCVDALNKVIDDSTSVEDMKAKLNQFLKDNESKLSGSVVSEFEKEFDNIDKIYQTSVDMLHFIQKDVKKYLESSIMSAFIAGKGTADHGMDKFSEILHKLIGTDADLKNVLIDLRDDLEKGELHPSSELVKFENDLKDLTDQSSEADVNNVVKKILDDFDMPGLQVVKERILDVIGKKNDAVLILKEIGHDLGIDVGLKEIGGDISQLVNNMVSDVDGISNYTKNGLSDILKELSEAMKGATGGTDIETQIKNIDKLIALMAGTDGKAGMAEKLNQIIHNLPTGDLSENIRVNVEKLLQDMNGMATGAQKDMVDKLNSLVNFLDGSLSNDEAGNILSDLFLAKMDDVLKSPKVTKEMKGEVHAFVDDLKNSNDHIPQAEVDHFIAELKSMGLEDSLIGQIEDILSTSRSDSMISELDNVKNEISELMNGMANAFGGMGAQILNPGFGIDLGFYPKVQVGVGMYWKF